MNDKLTSQFPGAVDLGTQNTLGSYLYTGHVPLPSSIWTSSAEDQLQAFRNNMAPHFPFIVIPLYSTAEQLYATKPIMYENIMMVVSYPYVSRHSKLRSEALRSLTEYTFVQGKKSLDLLQGIIVFAAWYHQSQGPSPQMTNMVQLATALVFDLGLHRAPSPFRGHAKYTEAMEVNINAKQKRTLEERRTFLGLFCLSRA
jgi:hypothetical protein